MRIKGMVVSVFLVAVILCWPVSAMYPSQTGTYSSDTSPTSDWVTEEELNQIKSGGVSGDPLKYVGQLPSPSQQNTMQGADSSSSDSSQGTSTGSSATQGSSSPESSAGNAVNGTSNTPTESGTQAAGGSEKAYESAKAGAAATNDTPWGFYVVGVIVSVIAIGVTGFHYRDNLFKRLR